MVMDKTFDPAAAEARILDLWESRDAFVAGANARPGAKPFSIMIPPPNVTGALHIGHAFNNTIQDILARWHRMRGDDVLWQPGQDHAGIATQLVVERKLAAEGRPGRREMGRADFVAEVWKWKAESGDTIINQLRRLGASCDWSRNAFTMSGAPGAPEGEEGNFHDAVIRAFVEMHERGLIYRGKRLVNWDPHFETAISDLEVENIEVAGQMWHFKYPLVDGVTYRHVEKDADGNVVVDEERDYISIATTRPETMLGDGAVAVHPSDARYAPLIGKLCEIPVGPKAQRRRIPIITDDYPDPDFGSGAVKITGAHDFNDYAVAERGNIPKYRLMDGRARLRADGAPYAEAAVKAAEIAARMAAGEAVDAGEIDTLNLVPDEYRGLDRFEARTRVVEAIDAEGLMLRVEDKPVMQPFGDRSKVVIEPMLTDQWFVDTARIVGPAIEAARDGRTKIMPESGEKVYFHWLENIEPWCISRQLWWGHRIPVWYGPDLDAGSFVDDEGDGALDIVETGALLLEPGFAGREPRTVCATDFAAAAERFHAANSDLPTPLHAARVVEVADAAEAKEVFARALADYQFSQDPTRLVYPVWRDADVLDTWFSSGLWPIGTLGWPEETEALKRYFPTSVLVTGQDILFFWVARMMMMQLALVDDVPFRTVYLHGLVRDARGEKMSKTRGNVIDPLSVIDEYGADALRFTLAQLAVLGGSPKLSDERIRGNRNFGTKLWNACRFAEMNGVWVGHATQAEPPGAQETVNRWIMGETGRVREAVDAALAGWKINEAAQTLHAFVWGVVCDWYVEFAKPLLAGEGPARDETRKVMAWVLDQCLVLLHPVMPFITEELWAATGRRDGILAHASWPEWGAELADPQAEAEMRWVISLIEGVRSARAQMNVPAGLQVPLVMVGADDFARNAWAHNAALIRRLARIEGVSEAGEAPKGALTVPARGATFALPLAGLIDVAAEKVRIGKAIARLDREIGGLQGRLERPDFLASAPAHVVEEARANLALREDEAGQLRAALARLAEIG